MTTLQWKDTGKKLLWQKVISKATNWTQTLTQSQHRSQPDALSLFLFNFKSSFVKLDIVYPGLEHLYSTKQYPWYTFSLNDNEKLN